MSVKEQELGCKENTDFLYQVMFLIFKLYVFFIFYFRRHKLYGELFLVNMSLSGIYRQQGKLGQALRFVDGAIKSAEKSKDKDAECEALTTKSLVGLALL